MPSCQSVTATGPPSGSGQTPPPPMNVGTMKWIFLKGKDICLMCCTLMPTGISYVRWDQIFMMYSNRTIKTSPITIGMAWNGVANGFGGTVTEFLCVKNEIILEGSEYSRECT